LFVGALGAPTSAVVATVEARKRVNAMWKMLVQTPSAARSIAGLLPRPTKAVSTMLRRGSTRSPSRAGRAMARFFFVQ